MFWPLTAHNYNIDQKTYTVPLVLFTGHLYLSKNENNSKIREILTMKLTLILKILTTFGIWYIKEYHIICFNTSLCSTHFRNVKITLLITLLISTQAFTWECIWPINTVTIFFLTVLDFSTIFSCICWIWFENSQPTYSPIKILGCLTTIQHSLRIVSECRKIKYFSNIHVLEM